MTRQQEFMRAALRDVRSVLDGAPNDVALHTLYGGLCHKLPILVRVNGLCQTLAFLEDKATDPKRGRAYGLLMQHIASLFEDTQQHVLERVRDAEMSEYLLLSRKLLEAWGFYKRFAVSILHVQDAEAAEVGT